MISEPVVGQVDTKNNYSFRIEGNKTLPIHIKSIAVPCRQETLSDFWNRFEQILDTNAWLRQDIRTVRLKPKCRSDRTGELQYLGHTSVSIALRSWLDRATPLWRIHVSSKVMLQNKPYTTSNRLDHTRVPSKAIWVTAPHCETINQQTCLSDSTIELCSGILARKSMGRKPPIFLHWSQHYQIKSSASDLFPNKDFRPS
jgi:hypothetical protein